MSSALAPGPGGPDGPGCPAGPGGPAGPAGSFTVARNARMAVSTCSIGSDGPAGPGGPGGPCGPGLPSFPFAGGFCRRYCAMLSASWVAVGGTGTRLGFADIDSKIPCNRRMSRRARSAIPAALIALAPTASASVRRVRSVASRDWYSDVWVNSDPSLPGGPDGPSGPRSPGCPCGPCCPGSPCGPGSPGGPGSPCGPVPPPPPSATSCCRLLMMPLSSDISASSWLRVSIGKLCHQSSVGPLGCWGEGSGAAGGPISGAGAGGPMVGGGGGGPCGSGGRTGPPPSPSPGTVTRRTPTVGSGGFGPELPTLSSGRAKLQVFQRSV